VPHYVIVKRVEANFMFFKMGHPIYWRFCRY